MRLLWLCNVAPSVVQKEIKGISGGSGLWVDHVLEDLRKTDFDIRIFCPFSSKVSGAIDDKCSYKTFIEGKPYVYLPELESQFASDLMEYLPDVIHIWGTEYGHTLAMVNACEKLNLLDRTVINIQGLCSVISRHYAENLPEKVKYSYTFRDILRMDNIAQQQKKFALRGSLEIKALKKIRHVIGRTTWDKACTKQFNPAVKYHFCNETLRANFYQDQWQYSQCTPYRIFASSCEYPVKGFHNLLEAFSEVIKYYPNARLAVPGRNPICGNNWKQRLRQPSYFRYLEKMIFDSGLEDKIDFLGNLDADQMKAQYLKANVFVMPSVIENSPNSLGEAMLLGVPCVASDVGGVTDLMTHKSEGFVYQGSAPYMLSHYIQAVFEMKEQAMSMGAAASSHAQKTHCAEINFKNLLEIYDSLAKRDV